MDEDRVAVSPATTYRILHQAGMTSRWNQRSSKSNKTGFEQPEAPYEHWHMDIAYDRFQSVFLFLISVLDGYSRFVLHHDVRIHMKEYDVELVLQETFEKYPGASLRLITDNGSQFVACEFKTYLRDIEFKHIRTSPYYPQSNGKIEAFHKNIKTECLRRQSFLSQQELRASVKNYIDSTTTTGCTAAFTICRQRPGLNGTADKIPKERDQNLEEARKRIQQNYLKQKTQNEKSIEPENGLMPNLDHALPVSG